MGLEKLETLPRDVADELGLPAAIVIGVDEHGSIVVHSHGINHAETVRCLSVAIHAVLTQHDELVLQGAAGPEAQRRAQYHQLGQFPPDPKGGH